MTPPADTASARPQFVGARVQRLEDPRLLTGQGNFVDDRRVHGLLHIAFKRSDHAHGRIKAIDVDAAAAMPGVVAVFTGEMLNPTITPIHAVSRMKGYHSTPITPLADRKVRYVGEPVAAVVAESRYLAEDAAERIVVDIEPLPNVVDPEQAAHEDAALLHEDAGTNVLASREFARGDVDAAFSNAAITAGGRFRFHRKSPVTMENRAYVAEFDRGSRSLTLHSTTQIPGIIRDALVDILDMPGHRVRVVAPDVGGGFGGKASLYAEEIAVCAISREMRRAVKWNSDRMEDLITSSQSFDEIIDAEIALDGDGHILGLRADVIGDVGAFSIYPWTAVIEPTQVVSFLPGPYRVENYAARVQSVATSKSPSGPYRGVGRPISTFVMERLIDMASHKLGHDPRDTRRRNLVREDEFPYKTGSGIVWDRSGFIPCLENACTGIDYDALRREQEASRREGRWVGIGLASYAELTGVGSRISVAPGMPINTGTETSTVQIDSSGAVTAVFGVASQGQGMETTLAQVVAQELGVKIEDVDVTTGDSASVAHGTGTYASRAAVLAGGAGTLAARAVREKVIRAAAHLFEAAETDIDTANGEIFVVGTDRRMTFRDLAKAVYSQMGRLPKEMRDEMGNLEATKVYDPFLGTTTSATHIAVVEIDPETYKVAVKKYIVAEDCGRIINPMIADGQAHGGVAQGIGAALLEEVVHDENGQILTASLVDYVVPGAGEVPAMDVIHVEEALPATEGGYRGLGEGGTIGAPAAVANAVSDALAPLGIEIMEVPITPERLFRLIEAAKTNR